MHSWSRSARFVSLTLWFGGGLSAGLGCRPRTTADPVAPTTEAAAPDAPADPGIDPHDDAALDAALRGEGLVGWMHSGAGPAGAITFTYRRPGDFFAFVILPTVGQTPESEAQLRALRRHDQVRLYGRLVFDGSPIRHIEVDRHEVVKPYRPAAEVHDYAYQTALESIVGPGPGPHSMVVKIHAIGDDPRVLIVEQGDVVLPVLVAEPAAVEGLYRGDKVRLRVEVAAQPERPPHLSLAAGSDAVEVLESIVARHGQPIELQGPLVLYPDSPALMFDIFALHVRDADGITRDYTLVNFEDMAVFQAIRQRLADTWAEHADSSVNRRNKRVNTRVLIKARGTMNMQAPNQANPQILLASPDDVHIEVLPEALPYETLMTR